MTAAPRTDPADALLVVPTEVERQRLFDLGDPALAPLEVCGFGPAAAAARTAQLLAERRPRRVFLVGLAGAYDTERHPPGTALVFGRVAVDGIGAGEGERFAGPHALGFPQWPGSPTTTPKPIEDELELWRPDATPDELRVDLLLTTCAASDGEAHAQERLARHPDAAAEDMEGFAVALACALFDVPLCIVRGISNAVGDRDGRNWRIPAALAAARRALVTLLG